MVADLCHFVLSYFRGEKAKRRHAKTRHTDFCVATFRVFAAKTRKGALENPPNGDFFVFSHGDLSPRHTKVRDTPCVAFSATVCRIFAWRGERSPCENPPKHNLAGFRMATFRVFAPKTRLYDMAQISHHKYILAYGTKISASTYGAGRL